MAGNGCEVPENETVLESKFGVLNWAFTEGILGCTRVDQEALPWYNFTVAKRT